MKTFLLIIFVVTISFSGSFYMLQKNAGLLAESGENSPLDVLFGTYLILLGETDYPDSFINNWIRVVFLVYTMFNLIIMLNLLIAVISDTFDRVKDSSDKARNAELLKLIIEYKQLSGDQGQETTYLYLLSNLVDQEDVDEMEHEWKGRVREMNKVVKQGQLKLEKKVDSIIPLYDQLRSDFHAHEERVHSQLTSLEDRLTMRMEESQRQLAASLKELLGKPV